jgi:NADPH2:quinone reductase
VRAVVLERFGLPEALVAAEVPDPVPGPGQVVVEVRIANVTFVETQLRAGRPPNPAMAPRLPAILGNGVGGVVAEVAEGTDPALLGQRVITSLGGSGGYAERAAADAAGLIAVPDTLDLPVAVALRRGRRRSPPPGDRPDVPAGARRRRPRRHRAARHPREDPAAGRPGMNRPRRLRAQ